MRLFGEAGLLLFFNPLFGDLNKQLYKLPHYAHLRFVLLPSGYSHVSQSSAIRSHAEGCQPRQGLLLLTDIMTQQSGVSVGSIFIATTGYVVI